MTQMHLHLIHESEGVELREGAIYAQGYLVPSSDKVNLTLLLYK